MDQRPKWPEPSALTFARLLGTDFEEHSDKANHCSSAQAVAVTRFRTDLQPMGVVESEDEDVRPIGILPLIGTVIGQRRNSVGFPGETDAASLFASAIVTEGEDPQGAS